MLDLLLELHMDDNGWEISKDNEDSNTYCLLKKNNDGGSLLDATVYVICTDVAVDEVLDEATNGLSFIFELFKEK